MRKTLHKKLKYIGLLFSLFITQGGLMYAAIVDIPGGSPTSTQAGSITPLVDVLVRAVNLVTGLAGFGFMVMILIAGYKYAMAQGDPKGLQGAKDTLTLALTGFVIVVGVFVIIRILVNMLGLNTALISPVSMLRNAINSFIAELNSCNSGLGGLVDCI